MPWQKEKYRKSSKNHPSCLHFFRKNRLLQSYGNTGHEQTQKNRGEILYCVDLFEYAVCVLSKSMKTHSFTSQLYLSTNIYTLYLERVSSKWLTTWLECRDGFFQMKWWEQVIRIVSWAMLHIIYNVYSCIFTVGAVH